MEITLKNFPKLEKKLRKIGFVLEDGEDAFNEIGLFLTASIEARTMKGKDVDGKAFTPYSPGYAKRRSEAGHPVDKVNLFFSGLMLNALFHDAGSDRVQVYFLPTTDKSNVSSPTKAYFLNEDRHFFGISDKERKKMAEIYANYVKEAMSG